MVLYAEAGVKWKPIVSRFPQTFESKGTTVHCKILPHICPHIISSSVKLLVNTVAIIITRASYEEETRTLNRKFVLRLSWARLACLQLCAVWALHFIYPFALYKAPSGCLPPEQVFPLWEGPWPTIETCERSQSIQNNPLAYKYVLRMLLPYLQRHHWGMAGPRLWTHPYAFSSCCLCEALSSKSSKDWLSSKETSSALCLPTSESKYAHARTKPVFFRFPQKGRGKTGFNGTYHKATEKPPTKRCFKWRHCHANEAAAKATWRRGSTRATRMVKTPAKAVGNCSKPAGTET